MPPKFKHSLSRLESRLVPVVQKHHAKLEQLKQVYDESKICFNEVEQNVKRFSQNGENINSILSKEDQDFIESAVTYKRRPVSIFMGQRNCGKSSLLNEVLRKSCLPTHENPCTARMVQLTYGAVDEAYLVDTDCQRAGESLPCKHKKVPGELVNLPEERRREFSEVRKLVLATVNLPVLQCGVDFIDSPGFGENIILDQMISDFMNNDIEPVIVYVINGKEMLTTQDIDAILHLRQTFPRIPIIFVVNKIDIDTKALTHDLGDISDDEEREKEMGDSIREQKRVIDERVRAIFDRLKTPCRGTGISFLPKGAEFGQCDYFHTVSSMAFRRARLAKGEHEESDCQYIDSFVRFEESFVKVIGENLEAMDEKLVTCISMYFQGISSLVGRVRHGIREAVENMPLLTQLANATEGKMKELLATFIEASFGDKELVQKAVKTNELKELLLFNWTQIQEANAERVQIMCLGPSSVSLVGLFNLEANTLLSNIPPGSTAEREVQRLWYVTEAKNLAVTKLSEQVDAYVVDRYKKEINDLLELLFTCQKTLQDPYIKLLLKRAYGTRTTKLRRTKSFSAMMISTAAYGMYKSISKGIVNGIGEELKKLYTSKDLKKLFPSQLSMGIYGKWHEIFADNLISYISKHSQRISTLICEHASKELERMHSVFVSHIRRLEGLAGDFMALGREELQGIGKQLRPKIFLLTLRAFALRCLFAKGPVNVDEELKIGGKMNSSVYRCADSTCGWCDDHSDTKEQRSVAIRVVKLDTMNEEKRARYVRDIVYTTEVTDACQDNPYLVRFYGVLMPNPITLHLIMEEMHSDVLTWLQGAPRPMSARIRAALQVAQGLGALHQRHIVFLDIKPTNVLMTRCGHAKLNICKPESAMDQTPLGVPFHIHKDVYNEYDIGYNKFHYDIYAVGMLLWVMCEGSGKASPFPNCKNHAEMRELQETGTIPGKPEGTPRACWRLMEKCWRLPERLMMKDVIHELGRLLECV